MSDAGKMSVAGKVLLVVDDEEAMRMTVAANLELEGAEVIEASSAEEAIQILAQRPVDLVLSDVRMPGKSGVDLLLDVRARYQGLPVVLMTAFTSEEEILLACEAGVFAVLSKPFHMEDATATLSRALRSPVVLIVDDVEPEAEAAADALRSAGLRVETAVGGRSALERVGRGDVDVLLTDLVMPGMDGVETFARVRALDATVTVIVCSGYDVPQMIREAAAGGAAVCLQKPIDPRQLVRLVAQLRGGTQRQG